MNRSNRRYATVSASVFTLIAAIQVVRALSGFPVEINHYLVPVVASWGIALVAAALAVWGWRSR